MEQQLVFLSTMAAAFLTHLQLELSCECLFASPCSWEKEARVASNISKMDDMQARLRRNLEAIGMLNQQVSNAHARAHTHTLSLLYADRRRHGPTLHPTCCWARTEGDGGAFMRPTSKMSPCTSISSSCDKSRKKKKSTPDWAGLDLGGGFRGRGYKWRQETAVTCLSADKWFPFHGAKRGMYINTAATDLSLTA